MKEKILPHLVCLCLLSFAGVLAAATSFAWFAKLGGETEKHIDGEIGLRSYFYDGDGTEERPYEIVLPVHFYNLCRLQNLGIFPEKKYFQIGHYFDGLENSPSCLNLEGNKVGYLDMQSFSSSREVLPIGSENTPFVGHFNGNGIPITNLKVTGYPEDIGVFGYISYQGYVEGLVCEDLEIHSKGYNSNPSDQSNLLFSADIDDIFNSAHYLANDTNLTLYRYEFGSFEANNLKHTNGINGTTIVNINDPANLSGDIYNKAYFAPVFPNVLNDRFTYSWISSSSLINTTNVIDINNDGAGDSVIAFDLTALKNSSDFNSGGDMQADARISLIASTEVDNYIFSRVIQSYTIEFYSNGDTYSGDGSRGIMSASIFCDYVDNGAAGDRNTHYHHGNNIGFLAGHLDGSMKRCYVYNGKFTFNQVDFTPIMTESDTGLIGQISKSVINSIDPDLGLTTNGDVGIMNFSRIYSLIRNDVTLEDGTNVLACGRQMPSGSNSYINYVSYDPYINQETFGSFAKYMRHDNPAVGDYHYIVKTGTDMTSYIDSGYPIDRQSQIKSDFNRVDFLWNNIIEDEENIDRGLGVFKIVTAYNAEAISGEYGNYMLNNIDESVIINGSAKTKVYFSTAELDHTISGNAWDYPFPATSLPSYSDINSFDYPFSRDYNYMFELNLEDMAKAGTNNYMYNTDSSFLANYLYLKLINKYGAHITPGNPRFGFMFLNDQNERLTSLSSYMPVNKPGAKHNYNGKYYPDKSIVFHIDNPNGANVSVVGRNDDITIYRNDVNSSAAVTALYSMKSSFSNVDYNDANRYFTYDVESGATSTKTVNISNMDKDDGKLYGHIFKLPPGDYCLGARSGTAHIYFLAVQGQTDATVGDKTMANMGNSIEFCNFLTQTPTLANYPSSLEISDITFKANFNSGIAREYYVKTKNDKGVNCLWLDFTDLPDEFVTYLMTYSPTKTACYIQNTRYQDLNIFFRTS